MNKKYLSSIIVLLIVGLTVVFFANKQESFIGKSFKLNNQGSETKGGVYNDSNKLFSFNYPEYLHSSEINQGDSRTILFQGDDSKKGFQLNISTFSEDVELSPERIKKDLPDLIMENVEVIAIDGVQAVVFTTRDSETSFSTREIWFVRSGYFYQISTYVEFDIEMVEILSTWKWL